MDRAHWTDEHSGILCEIWVDQIKKGNCVDGVMNNRVVREVIRRYYVATNLVHAKSQIINRIRQLNSYWQFIQRLHKDSGLGCRKDATVDATDQWWEDNTKVIPKLLRNFCFACPDEHLVTMIISSAGPFRVEVMQVGVATFSR